jgi:hypothetical protein
MKIEEKDALIDQQITFTYKGARKVQLEVEFADEDYVIGKLLTNYYGKNGDWYVGETKAFNRPEMRNITVL